MHPDTVDKLVEFVRWFRDHHKPGPVDLGGAPWESETEMICNWCGEDPENGHADDCRQSMAQTLLEEHQ